MARGSGWMGTDTIWQSKLESRPIGDDRHRHNLTMVLDIPSSCAFVRLFSRTRPDLSNLASRPLVDDVNSLTQSIK